MKNILIAHGLQSFGDFCAIYIKEIVHEDVCVTVTDDLVVATNHLKTCRFDLVILSTELVGGSGYNLLEEIGKLNPRPAVIVTTGYSRVTVEEAIKAKGLQADLVLETPIDLETFRQALVSVGFVC